MVPYRLPVRSQLRIGASTIHENTSNPSLSKNLVDKRPRVEAPITDHLRDPPQDMEKYKAVQIFPV